MKYLYNAEKKEIEMLKKIKDEDARALQDIASFAEDVKAFNSKMSKYAPGITSLVKQIERSTDNALNKIKERAKISEKNLQEAQ
jgi:hypothetical protein